MKMHTCCPCFKRIRKEFLKLSKRSKIERIRSMTPTMQKMVLSHDELVQFMDNLRGINIRDYAIARIMLLAEKHIIKVLEMNTDQVDFEGMTINFGPDDVVPIDSDLSDALFMYTSQRDDIFKISEGFKAPLFVTRTGERVTRSRILYVFRKASSGMVRSISCNSLVATARAEANRWIRTTEPDDDTGHSR
jgi:hypothetical protein